MIREDIKQQGKLSSTLTLDDDEDCLCASDIYTKSDNFWRNREICQITTKRLSSIPIDQIKKIKVLNEHPMTGYNLFRVSTDEKETVDMAIRTIDVPGWFCNALWITLLNAGHKLNKKRETESEIEGTILKKSQFMGKWEPKYAKIDAKSGLSYGKKDDNLTVKIKETN